MMNNNIKFCREELEMTQKELGNVFGVSFKTVAGWENSHDTMPLTKLVKFCNLYKFSIDYVTGLSKINNYVELDKLDRIKIGNKLKRIRQKLGLTQETIASECMISQATYQTSHHSKIFVYHFHLYIHYLSILMLVYYVLQQQKKMIISFYHLYLFVF